MFQIGLVLFFVAALVGATGLLARVLGRRDNWTEHCSLLGFAYAWGFVAYQFGRYGKFPTNNLVYSFGAVSMTLVAIWFAGKPMRAVRRDRAKVKAAMQHVRKTHAEPLKYLSRY